MANSPSKRKAPKRKNMIVSPVKKKSAKRDLMESLLSTIPSEEQSKKTHKKRKKIKDANYSLHTKPKRRSNKKNHENEKRSESLLRMRTDNSTTRKTAVIYYLDQFQPKASEQLIGEVLQEELKKVETDRPIGRILETNPNESPIKAELATPNKTVVYRDQSYGGINCFTDQPKIARPAKITSIPQSSSFFKSKPCKAVCSPPTNDEKKFITDEPGKLAKEAKKEKRRNGGRRLKTQKAVMKHPKSKSGASANEYMQAARAEFPFPDTDYEYTHNAPHAMLGEKKAQKPKRIFIAPKAGNTRNMFGENATKIITNSYPNSRFEATTKMIPKTHISIDMSHKTTTPDFQFPITYDMQDPVTPPFSDGQYINSMAKALTKASKSVDQKPATKSQAKSPATFSFFYQKNKPADTDISSRPTKKIKSK